MLYSHSDQNGWHTGNVIENKDEHRTGPMMLVGNQGAPNEPYKSHESYGFRLLSSLETDIPFYSQYHTLPQSQPRSGAVPLQAQMGYPIPPPQMHNSMAFNMGPMAGSLPNLRGNVPQQHYSPGYGLSNSGSMLPLQPIQYAPQYQMPMLQQQVFANGSSFPGYQPFHQQQSSPMYPPSPYGLQSPQSAYIYSDQMSGPASHYSERALGMYGSESPSQAIFGGSFGSMTNASSVDVVSITSAPRGPPRKPRQSGHALWVGNLPLGARVIDLKDHFSREATLDIESLKLISKSNCAFVNYRTQAACAAAMARFHDSRFHGTRLVCRLRRISTGIPSTTPIEAYPVSGLADSPKYATEKGQLDEVKIEESLIEKVAVKYFVLKSLTLQDLEVSTRTGTWATQAHNEELLNDAYKSAEEVFLIFSANKSGEYFGYARMGSAVLPSEASEISTADERPSSVESQSVTLQSQPEPGPKSIPTPATEWAPKGRIIDDSARGTIFWEADMEESPSFSQENDASSSSDSDSHTATAPAQSERPIIARSKIVATAPTEPQPQSSQDELKEPKGNSFRVEWISTRKVPFYRTRGLRNPWNANREVKIARDGTELETTTGSKLVALFGGGLPYGGRSGVAQP